jgi:ankyrin repeat protein
MSIRSVCSPTACAEKSATGNVSACRILTSKTSTAADVNTVCCKAMPGSNSLRVVQQLVAAGADTAAKSDKNATPLMFATAANAPDIVSFLTAHRYGVLLQTVQYPRWQPLAATAALSVPAAAPLAAAAASLAEGMCPKNWRTSTQQDACGNSVLTVRCRQT